MIGLFWILSIISMITGGLLAIACIIDAVDQLKELSHKGNDENVNVFGTLLVMIIAIGFMYSAIYMVDLDIRIDENYKIGEENAYNTFNETEYNYCVEYTDINDYKLFPENRSVYCYCKGYANAFENKEEYVNNNRIKNNLSI